MRSEEVVNHIAGTSMVHFAPVPALPKSVRDNAYHLYFDVFWFGVLYGSAISYLTVYAARLGVSSLLVGLLIPPGPHPFTRRGSGAFADWSSAG